MWLISLIMSEEEEGKHRWENTLSFHLKWLWLFHWADIPLWCVSTLAHLNHVMAINQNYLYYWCCPPEQAEKNLRGALRLLSLQHKLLLSSVFMTCACCPALFLCSFFIFVAMQLPTEAHPKPWDFSINMVMTSIAGFLMWSHRIPKSSETNLAFTDAALIPSLHPHPHPSPSPFAILSWGLGRPMEAGEKNTEYMLKMCNSSLSLRRFGARNSELQPHWASLPQCAAEHFCSVEELESVHNLRWDFNFIF